ncbi:hypothetical protein M3Y99_01584800 [Aphelenchoides fujianensis]|nr:hypothetical protein M3Y99_01584800 [Aphelenchoides fujianensis]
MLHRLVVLAAVCALVARAAPALEQQALEKKVVLVATPPRFDGDKQVYEIPRSDIKVDVKFGDKTNSPNISAVLTLESRTTVGPTTSWIYGASCTGQSCPTDATKKYDDSTGGTPVSSGGLTGKWFTDTITIGPAAKLTNVDFVALSQFYQDEQYDGLLSLGIGAQHQTVDKLFALGKDPWITIYTGPTNDGQLVIGRNGHDKCNNAAMWQVSNGAWEVEKSTLEIDGATKKDGISLGFSITKKSTLIPSDSFDAVVKDANYDLSTNTVGDVSKLKSIKITIGSNSWTLKPEDFSWKDTDGKVKLQLDRSPDSNPSVTLGVPFLTNRCLVLNGADKDSTKWQVGVGDPKSGAGVFGLSALLLSVVSVFHFLRL